MSEVKGILSVRRATISDLDCLTRFSAAMAQETEDLRLDLTRLREGTQALVRDSQHGFFLVGEMRGYDEKRVISQLMITYEWSDWRNGIFWWIQSVYVEPAWRRQGVFRKMHAAVINAARADPAVCGVRLYVEMGNLAAQDVYRKVGLRPSSYTVFEHDFVLGHRHVQDRPDQA